MRVGICQINTIVGDLEGNVERCLAAIHTASKENPDLVILPEMAVPGYPPRDILYDPSFIQAVCSANLDLARRLAGGPPAVVGTINQSETKPPGHPGLFNVTLLIHNGEIQQVAAKRLLPVYDVFYEPRWFLPGRPSQPIPIAGMQVGFLICEDMWDEGYDIHPGAELRAAGAQLLVCTAATPYRQGVMQERLYHARRQGCPLVHVNLYGANDELIFDGRSFAIDQQGNLIAQLNAFAEQVQVIDLDTAAPVEPDEISLEHERFSALTLGVRDFVEKNHLPQAFISASGGIDSSVVAVIAAEALGPERVTAVAIPSRYSDPRSTECARLLADRLGIGFQVVELEGLHKAAESSLAALLDEGTTAENIQARLRAMIMMSFVNRYGGLLLNTSNKTELALGYATLYGDTAGSLCPIADLTKPEVYALARWINREGQLIPAFTMERPPSAELRPGQVDPFDYPKVAPLIEQLVQDNQSNPALRNSEHKRWQFGVVLKVSKKAFGTGRMIPITRR